LVDASNPYESLPSPASDLGSTLIMIQYPKKVSGLRTGVRG